MMSDDSENDGVLQVERSNENNVYYKKYKLLLEECENLQNNNERLVYRINAVKKITKHRMEQVDYINKILKTRYGEDWTEIPDTEPLDEDLTEYEAKNIVKTKQEPSNSGTNDTATSNGGPEQQGTSSSKAANKKNNDKSSGGGGKTKKAGGKRKGPKAERDPRAPKRPSNPFFQFCQDQRQPLLEELTANLKPGEVEPNKQELTRQLALKWKTLSTQDKQIYVDMYEASKAKYAIEMTEYNANK